MVYTPGVFMQADMDTIVHVNFEGVMDELLVKIYPKIYTKYAVKEKWKTVIYAALARLLCGTSRASLLFWRNLTSILVNDGHTINPYEWCNLFHP